MTLLRHALSYAKPGQAGRLAEILVEVADGLKNAPGCEQYIVSRVKGDPDAVAVSERWRSEADMQAALAGAKDDPNFAEVMEILDRERGGGPVDLEPIGGVGFLPSPVGGYTHQPIAEFEDLAPKFGMEAMGQTRSVSKSLGLTQIGSQHYTMPPGARQLFGHNHANAEELYIALAGAGRIALDDDVRTFEAGDAVRVGPGVMRAVEAGPDGLTFLAVGASRPGEYTMETGWWPHGAVV